MEAASIKKTYEINNKTKNIDKLINANNNVKPHKYTTPVKKLLEITMVNNHYFYSLSKLLLKLLKHSVVN